MIYISVCSWTISHICRITEAFRFPLSCSPPSSSPLTLIPPLSVSLNALHTIMSLYPSQTPETPSLHTPTPPAIHSPPRMRIQSRVISWLSRPDNQQSYFTAKGMQMQTLVRVGALKVSVQSLILNAVCLCFFLCLLSSLLSFQFNYI